MAYQSKSKHPRKTEKTSVNWSMPMPLCLLPSRPPTPYPKPLTISCAPTHFQVLVSSVCPSSSQNTLPLLPAWLPFKISALR